MQSVLYLESYSILFTASSNLAIGLHCIYVHASRRGRQ